MTLYYALLVLLTLLEAVGSIYLKKSTGGNGVTDIIKSPYFYLGGFLYFAAAVLNIYVLRFLDYSVAFPLKAITYIWTVALAYMFFKEKITRRKVIGILLIIAGAALISA
mgnify:CR=1 FL=1